MQSDAKMNEVMRLPSRAGVPLLSLLVSLTLFPVMGVAQTTRPAGPQLVLLTVPQTTSAQSVSPVRASETARYARYTPLFCSVLPGRLSSDAASNRFATWHDRWPQTAATRQADSVYMAGAIPAVRAGVRTCLASVNAATTPSYHLWSLGRGWLSIDEDTKAAEAFALLLKAQAKAPVLERAWWLQRLVGIYASADNPVRHRTALDYLAQLDALGPPAIGFRLAARNAIYKTIAGRDSVSWMATQARDAILLSQTLTGDLQHEWIGEILQAVINYADVDVRQRHYKAALDTIESARNRYRSVDPFRIGMMDGMYLRASELNMETRAPATKPSLFYTPGQTKPIPPPTTWPVKGKVTLLIRVMGNVRLIGREDFSVYQFALRVRERFGDQVDIVAIAGTMGDYAGRLVSDTVEAGHIREHVHDYMRLPFPLVVFAPKVTGKDKYGRLIREPDPHFYAIVTLVDKRGVIRDFMNGLDEMRWMNMLGEMVREPGPS